ncbi:AAA ATPase [Calothrix sp. NIES-4071]|nr:AAA ATPase [Calothrix sp. NIES-4071]BAZ59564.1 AAA ATPase [Calothrix sp. NIES-4105]
MKNARILTKLLWISLIISLVFSFYITDIAYARGGCFAGGTVILTTQGNKPIEHLHQGDSIIGYNFTAHKPEVGNIGEIQILSSPNYLLINNKIKVTATHPFYIKTSTGVKLEQAQKLKIGAQLIGKGESRIVIDNLDYINENITVYNLISVSPNHNFYADGILVHNKGGGGGGSVGGGGGRGSYYSGNRNSSFTPINSKTLPKYILIFLVLLLVLLPAIFWHEIYNLIRFFNKEFTNDSELSQFATSINPKFTNRYSMKYSKDNEQWNIIPIESEISEQQYQDILSKNQLIERVSSLFNQYQLDWTMKNFEHMVDYIAEPFYSQQCNIFKRDFDANFDIVYNSELIEAAPISLRQSENKHIFRIQVNAKMTNFVISPTGYVLSGESYPRFFSEYWDIGVDSSGKCYLIKINQMSKSCINKYD